MWFSLLSCSLEFDFIILPCFRLTQFVLVSSKAVPIWFQPSTFHRLQHLLGNILGNGLRHQHQMTLEAVKQIHMNSPSKQCYPASKWVVIEWTSLSTWIQYDKNTVKAICKWVVPIRCAGFHTNIPILVVREHCRLPNVGKKYTGNDQFKPFIVPADMCFPSWYSISHSFRLLISNVILKTP